MPPSSPDAGLTQDDRRVLRILETSSVSAKVADYGLSLIAPLAVLEATGSAASAILVISLRGVAYIASPVLGALLDRMDRRLVFVWAQMLQGACVAVAATAMGSAGLVATMMLVSGLGGVATSISGQFVLIPHLISEQGRPHAVARLTASIEYAKVAGFLGGGVAVAQLGSGGATWCVALLYAAAGAVGALLPRDKPQSAARGPWRTDLLLGFRWLRQPSIGWLVMSMSVSNLALGGLGTALVTVFADGGASVGWISGAMAAGLLAGAIGARLAPRALPGHALPIRILVLQVVGTLSLIGIAIGSAAWAVSVMYGVMSAALGVSNVLSITYRQDVIPLAMAGRVNSVIRLFIAGAIPLSGLVYALAEGAGVWIWGPAVLLQFGALGIWVLYVLKYPTTELTSAR